MPSFVIMGNSAYYFLLEKNIDFIRRTYPTARILCYDWGDNRGRAAFACDDPNVTVVDWGPRIADISRIRAETPFAQQQMLALRYNARFKRTLARRLTKAVLKRLPRSPLAAPAIAAGLRFENMLMQKVPCMRDALTRTGDEGLVFLDADAFLLRPLDDLFARDDFDVAVTLIDTPNWERDQCAVINSGVIFFRRPAAGLALVEAWSKAMETCNEWLREQTALTRMIHAAAPEAFKVGRLTAVSLAGGASVRLLAMACAEFNNCDMSRRPDTSTRVWHVANTAHNPQVFAQVMGLLREERS